MKKLDFAKERFDGRIEQRELKITLGKDGWYYTNSGHRFHGEKRGTLFIEIWDLEKYDTIKSN